MVEESDSPGSDYLAERRARRATESGEAAMQRRAEAAEATVKTLESHVTSLQARLSEAEEDRRRSSALLEAERAHANERESELRRVKQREYAEQQLRVEAEGRLSGLEREGRERATRAEQNDEQALVELAQRIDGLQRQLAEAEQAAAAERAALRRAEGELSTRVAGLERRADELQRSLVVERSARERAERELAGIQEGHRRMEGLLGEIRTLIARLGPVIGSLRGRPETPAEPVASVPAPVSRMAAPAASPRGEEMADALAAAVERLRARASIAPPLDSEYASEPEPEPVKAEAEAEAGAPGAPEPPAGVARAPEPPTAAQADPRVAERSVEGAEPPSSSSSSSSSSSCADLAEEPFVEAEVPAEPAPKRPSNKHSMSLIARLRIRRKQRRERR